MYVDVTELCIFLFIIIIFLFENQKSNSICMCFCFAYINVFYRLPSMFNTHFPLVLSLPLWLWHARDKFQFDKKTHIQRENEKKTGQQQFVLLMIELNQKMNKQKSNNSN